jgi:RimJ/RimL family protein N-acetyltransferase
LREGVARVLDKALPLFGRLENYVHAENKASVRWLKWLGFTMDEAAPYGPRGENFIHFYKALSDKH